MANKKIRKKAGGLKEEYQKSWSYIKESKKFIYFVIGVFFIFTLIGFFIPTSDFFMQQILEFIKELIEKTKGMSQGELISFIFLNNLYSSFFGMVLGIFLGVFPIILAIMNGYLLGFVASLSVQDGGILVLWRIFPHGIFELPAIFISLGLGLKFGMFIFQKKKIESFRNYLWNSLRVFFFVVVPLLIIAGIIEGTFIFLSG